MKSVHRILKLPAPKVANKQMRIAVGECIISEKLDDIIEIPISDTDFVISDSVIR